VTSGSFVQRGVLPTVVRRCVWSRNLVNERWPWPSGGCCCAKRKEKVALEGDNRLEVYFYASLVLKGCCCRNQQSVLRNVCDTRRSVCWRPCVRCGSSVIIEKVSMTLRPYGGKTLHSLFPLHVYLLLLAYGVYVMASLVVQTEECDGPDMWHVRRRGEMHTGFWWGNLKEGDHLEDLGVDGEDRIKMDLQERGWECGLAAFVNTAMTSVFRKMH
jgi:hypothetical protein